MTRSEEQASALKRLGTALVEQDRLSECCGAAIGTSDEPGALVRLSAADEDVASREAWLRWVEDDEYRGLNAGPFELRAESSVATAPPSTLPAFEAFLRANLFFARSSREGGD